MKKIIPDSLTCNKENVRDFRRHNVRRHEPKNKKNTYKYDSSNEESNAGAQDRIVFLLFAIVGICPVAFWLRQLVVAGWWANVFVVVVVTAGHTSYRCSCNEKNTMLIDFIGE